MGIFPKDRDLTRSLDEVEFIVDASYFQQRIDEFHVRLDQFLAAHLKWRSRSSLKNLIKDGYVHLAPAAPDEPTGLSAQIVERRPGRKLLHGTRVTVVIPEENRIPPSDAPAELAILYEDAEVVVVDKPPNLAVHPSGRHLSDTLIQRAHAYYRAEIEAHRVAPRLCHRLDRETSGIVLIGKRPVTHTLLSSQFEKREVEKEYLAIVWGEVAEDEGRIDLAIGPSRISRIRLKMAVLGDGQLARTDWCVIERRPGYTLIKCTLHTGRQHQIRVHLAAIGHPIVGDKLYGPDEGCFERAADGTLTEHDLAQLELPYHALHNHRLKFTSPDGDQRIEVTSALPGPLAAFIGR